MLAGAAILQMVPVHTGWDAIDHYFAHYYVFFLAGYLLAPHVFAIADWAGKNAMTAVGLVVGWAVLNGVLVSLASPIEGWRSMAQLPLVSLVLGGMGAMAVVTISSLLSKYDVARFIRYCGQHSIVIYISFTIPMATLRTVLLKTQVIPDVGWVSLIVWMFAVLARLSHRVARRHRPGRSPAARRTAKSVWDHTVERSDAADGPPWATLRAGSNG
jgi:uncharacterized membrane protein YcfT